LTAQILNHALWQPRVHQQFEIVTPCSPLSTSRCTSSSLRNFCRLTAGHYPLAVCVGATAAQTLKYHAQAHAKANAAARGRRRSKLTGHSPGLARIVRRVEPASAEASLLSCGPGQIVIEHDQQLMEADVVDNLLVQPFGVHP
jgi:hypothetical protein